MQKHASRWVRLGEVATDTGWIVVVDPCRVDEASGLMTAAARTSAFTFPGGVATRAGIGDGIYPVTAEIVDMGPDLGERVARVVIDFKLP